jgi:tRNA-2-methylthio-N6-dimethylallyladenosine synthase
VKYLIETYGCQMNVHDSERMAGLLDQIGYEPTEDARDADVIVINTCSVRERAEEKLFTRLGEIRQQALEDGHRPVVAVAGCVAQQEGAAILKRSNAVDVVIGTQNIKRLPMLVERAVESRTDRAARAVVDLDPIDDISFPLGIARRTDPVKAYVTIIEGCNEFCAFCVVPYTRGHERMRPVADIVADARQAVESGAREVQLLGQIVNHYQAPDDPGCDFAALLERLQAIDGLDRIRFASPHPRHVTPRMIAAMRNLS